MSKKYILQPDGSILENTVADLTEENNSNDIIYSDDNKNISDLSTKINNKENDYSESYQQSNFKSSREVKNRVELDSALEAGSEVKNKNLFNFTDSNKSFNFPTNGEVTDIRDNNVSSFKNFNSFTDDFKEIGMFANELELLGVHPGVGDYRKLYSLKWLFFLDYILEISGLIALIEIVTTTSELFLEGEDFVDKSGLLKLGTHTFHTPDFISPYFLKTLNYPTRLSNLNDRLSSFFLGLNVFLRGDEAYRLPILEKLRKNIGVPGIQMNYTRIIVSILLYTVEAQLQTGAKDNLIDLLIRKFQMQKHWYDDQLFKAKHQTDTEKLSLEFKYYYFKFAIERMHIGLNILNHEFFNLTYDYNKESPSTRVGLSRSIEKVKTKPIQSHPEDINLYKYNWDYEVTGHSQSQSIRMRALPQALQLPISFLANKLANKSFEDLKKAEIPLISADASLMQNFVTNKINRIPKELVREIENRLEMEYVPFYFQDIRTNEIIAFHAFIDNISDSYSANYQSTKGFGRIDAVKNYVDTTRAIQLSFTMAATSPDDHDLMWYQINKLVSMCYPQWSDAFVTNDKLFKYPFTQMPTASPLIRLRVGDLIKSNYSKQSLSRLHGIGDRQNIDDFIKNTIYSGENPIEKAINKAIKSYNAIISEIKFKLVQDSAAYRSKYIDHQILFENLEEEIKILDSNFKNEEKAQRDKISKLQNIVNKTSVKLKTFDSFYHGYKDPDEEFVPVSKDYIRREQERTGLHPYSPTMKEEDDAIKKMRSKRVDLNQKSIDADLALEEAQEVLKAQKIGYTKKRHAVEFRKTQQLTSLHQATIEKNKIDKQLAEVSSFKSPIKFDSERSDKAYLYPGLYKSIEKTTGGILEVFGLSLEDQSYLKVSQERLVRVIEEKDKYSIVFLPSLKDSNKGYHLYVDKIKLRPFNPSHSFKKIKKGASIMKGLAENIGEGLEMTGLELPNKLDTFQNALSEGISALSTLKNSLSDSIMNSTIQNVVGAPALTGEDLGFDVEESVNNPFTAAFESTQGRGLAGVITNLNIGNLNDSTWETSRPGSKAPIMVKIDISFDPIHDIQPGLDHHGMMRAPTYNVGRLMNDLFDDPYDE